MPNNTQKKVFLLYLRNSFPDCYCEPEKELIAIFTNKKTLLKKIEEAKKKYPILYQEDDIIITETEVNKLYSI